MVCKSATNLAHRAIKNAFNPHPPSEPTVEMSLKHALYLAIMHGIGSGVVNFGINYTFSLFSYAYRDDPVTEAIMKNEVILTVIITIWLTYVIDAVNISMDVCVMKTITPLLVPMRFEHNPVIGWFVERPSLDDLDKPSRHRTIFHHMWRCTIRGAVLAIPYCMIYIPLGFHSLTWFLNDEGNFPNNWPSVQLYKGVFAAVVASTSTPWICWFTLMRIGLQPPVSGVLPAGSAVTPPSSAVSQQLEEFEAAV